MQTFPFISSSMRAGLFLLGLSFVGFIVAQVPLACVAPFPSGNPFPLTENEWCTTARYSWIEDFCEDPVAAEAWLSQYSCKPSAAAADAEVMRKICAVFTTRYKCKDLSGVDYTNPSCASVCPTVVPECYPAKRAVVTSQLPDADHILSLYDATLTKMEQTGISAYEVGDLARLVETELNLGFEGTLNKSSLESMNKRAEALAGRYSVDYRQQGGKKKKTTTGTSTTGTPCNNPIIPTTCYPFGPGYIDERGPFRDESLWVQSGDWFGARMPEHADFFFDSGSAAWWLGTYGCEPGQASIYARVAKRVGVSALKQYACSREGGPFSFCSTRCNEVNNYIDWGFCDS